MLGCLWNLIATAQAEAARANGRGSTPLNGLEQRGLLGRPSQATSSMKRDSLPAEDEKLTKADQRRLARKKRETEWQAFNETRPDEGCVGC
jgi:hypothetical protein